MSLKSILSTALRRLLTEPELPTARVLPAAGLAVEVEDRNGARVTYTFDPMKASVELSDAQVRIWSDGLNRNGQSPWAFESAEKSVLDKLYRDIQKALRGPSRSLWKPALVGTLVTLGVIVVASPKAPAARAVAQAVVPVAPPAAPALLPPAATPTPPQAVLTPDEGRVMAALQGVKLPGSGATYYVFSDPNCPYCKELDKAVETVSGYQPIVLPLGYKPGSREISAAVMCAANPAKEWQRAIAGVSTAKPCEKGYKLVDANMEAFQKLGLSSTPTMVTPKGVLVTGAATPDELSAILQR